MPRAVIRFGHQRVLADHVVNVDRDVSDCTYHELPDRLHAFTAWGKPREKGVMDEVLRHQLIHDSVVLLVLELILESSDDLEIPFAGLGHVSS